MNSCELVTFVTALACGIVKCTPKEEISLLASIFGELATTLGTILEHQSLCEGKTAPPLIEPPDTTILPPPQITVLPSDQ